MGSDLRISVLFSSSYIAQTNEKEIERKYKSIGGSISHVVMSRLEVIHSCPTIVRLNANVSKFNCRHVDFRSSSFLFFSFFSFLST